MQVGDRVTLETTDGHTLRGRVKYLSADRVWVFSDAGVWNVRRDSIATTRIGT